MVRIQTILKSHSGFSLLELLISSAISLLAVGVVAFVFIMAIDTYNRVIRQYEAETEIIGAMITIRTALTSAVQVNYCGAAGGANNAYNTRAGAANNITLGCVFSGNYNNGIGGGTDLIAMTVSDMKRGGNTLAVDTSDMYATAIYYQRPTANLSGAIYMDQEKNIPGGWVRLSPVNAPFLFTRFVEFEVLNVKVLDNNGTIKPVTIPAVDIGKTIVSAEFRLVMRYFTQDQRRNFRWDPVVNLTAAIKDTMALNYDLEKRMKVTFANNSLDRSKYLAPRPLGHIHLFKFATGMSN